MSTFLKIPPGKAKLTVREADPRQQLDRIHNEFLASLTPQQRRLMAAGIAQVYTPQQQEILHRMEPYLEGLTLEQVKGLALYDQRIANQEEFNRGWQAGLESGEHTAMTIKIVVIVSAVLMILAALIAAL